LFADLVFDADRPPPAHYFLQEIDASEATQAIMALVEDGSWSKALRKLVTLVRRPLFVKALSLTSPPRMLAACRTNQSLVPLRHTACRTAPPSLDPLEAHVLAPERECLCSPVVRTALMHLCHHVQEAHRAVWDTVMEHKQYKALKPCNATY
jgi:hypothetical protein